MIFRQNSWRLYLGLGFGLVFIFIGINGLFTKLDIPVTMYGIFGLGWTAYAIYSYKNGYFKIINNQLIIPSFPKSRKVNLGELSEIKYTAGDYVFKDSKNEIRIVKELINKKDLAKFEQIFNELKDKHS